MSNDSERVRLLKLAAERGDAQAQYDLGFLLTGDLDDLEAMRERKRFIRLAARQGHFMAQSNIERNAPRNALANWLYRRGLLPERAIVSMAKHLLR